ncbi:DinB family protein [Candidatus Bathyarchaeota archaeon]|nr:DinB family protein [Candidatus Bathyarchaeota archaeon]
MNAVELIRYVHVARKNYQKALFELPWSEVIKDRGASFPSLRDIFVHSLGVEDRIINYVVPGRFPGYEKWDKIIDLGKFSNMDILKEHIEEVEKKVDSYLKNVTENELNRKVEVPRRATPTYLLSVEDILIHVAVENIYHMGEMEAIFYQLDKQPPFLDWSGFLQETVQK